MTNTFWQFRVLLVRNFRLFVADRTGFVLTVLQPFLIALLIWIALAHGLEDHRQADADIRDADAFVQKVEEDKENTQIIIKKHEENRLRYGLVYLDEVEKSTPDVAVVSSAHASARATVFFVMIAACIWMGLLSTCKEIVSEWPVLYRESHSTFSPGAYVFAKLVVFGSALLLQTAALTALTQLPLLGWPGWLPFLGICALNWLTALCACALGLLVSCLIGSIRWALALIPVFMMPQIMLGGLLRPPAQVTEGQRSFWREAGAAATFQRWAFEAELAVDAHWDQDGQEKPDSQCLKVVVPYVDKNEESRLYQLKTRRSTLDGYFFVQDGGQCLKHAVTALLIQFFSLSLLTVICLVLRIGLANRGSRFCA